MKLRVLASLLMAIFGFGCPRRSEPVSVATDSSTPIQLYVALDGEWEHSLITERRYRFVCIARGETGVPRISDLYA